MRYPLTRVPFVLSLLLLKAAALAFQINPRDNMLFATRIYASTLTTGEEETSTTGIANENDSTLNKRDSAVLPSILSDSVTTKDFFQHVWQTQPMLFTSTASQNGDGDGTYRDEKIRETPLEELTCQGWHVLIDLLEQGATEQEGPEVALILKNRKVQNREACLEKYGSSLFAPYLVGCSIVQNHADLISPWIAAVCQDLEYSFPYTYANTYLTPPNSQAMNPHADDRDVFVIQLVGSKHWEVFQEVPIDYPYTHEQVGKQGIPVPPYVLQGDHSISTTLTAGDVLYIPRGHVHQARCSDSLSVHVTVAIATFDWTLAGMLNMATSSILLSKNDYRKSIVPANTKEEIAETN